MQAALLFVDSKAGLFESSSIVFSLQLVCLNRSIYEYEYM